MENVQIFKKLKNLEFSELYVSLIWPKLSYVKVKGRSGGYSADHTARLLNII